MERYGKRQAACICIRACLVWWDHPAFKCCNLVKRKISQRPIGNSLGKVRAEVLMDEQGHRCAGIGVCWTIKRLCYGGEGFTQVMVFIYVLCTLLQRAKFSIQKLIVFVIEC